MSTSSQQVVLVANDHFLWFVVSDKDLVI